MNKFGGSARTGVLASGGLDSCILIAHLLESGRAVQPFYIKTGVTWESAELQGLRRFLEAIDCERLLPLVTLELPLHDLYQSHWSLTGHLVPDEKSPDEAVFLPGRNALLLVKAAIWCQLNGITELALATLGTSPFADATAEFASRFQDTINYGSERTLRVKLPFDCFKKREVMQLGRHFPLQYSFSCIDPVRGMHCGVCNKCAERQLAFSDAEIVDRTEYAQASDRRWNSNSTTAPEPIHAAVAEAKAHA